MLVCFLQQVDFIDFFLADQLCSLVRPLFDLNYAFCFFFTGVFVRDDINEGKKKKTAKPKAGSPPARRVFFPSALLYPFFKPRSYFFTIFVFCDFYFFWGGFVLTKWIGLHTVIHIYTHPAGL